MPGSLPDDTSAAIEAIAQGVARVGGRALIVGGSARDQLLGRPPRDRDVEVLGLDLDTLMELLAEFGRPIRVGRSFESLRLPGLDIDFGVAEDPECRMSKM